MKWIVREMDETSESVHAKYTAWSKARDDIDTILTQAGARPLDVYAPQKKREEAGKFKKLWYHEVAYRAWKKAIQQLQPGDTVYIQFPARNHTFFLGRIIEELNRKKISTIAYIHDLDYLRYARMEEVPRSMRWRIEKEELSSLRLFTRIVVHNNRMREYIMEHLAIPAERIRVLGMFDYLVSDNTRTRGKLPYDAQHAKVIIAGNLFPEKAGYSYHLPKDVDFEVYGPNYTAELTENIHYNGAFPPADLPFVLRGHYGLVWDGDSAETCSGVWGEYLHYNNPHKTSLYLASGLPVIVWQEAAIAEFVKEYQVGIAVGSLYELNKKLKTVTAEDYAVMAKNAEELSQKLKSGAFTLKAGEL